MRLTGNMGYQTPELTFGIAPELNLRRFYARGTSFYRTSNKRETGDGHSAGGQFEAYLRANRFLFGGGVNFVKLTTSQYQKGGFRPLVGGAVEYKVDPYPSRFFAYYVMRGTDDHNGLQGPNFRWEVDLKPKVRITPLHLAVYRFYPTDNPQLGTKMGFSATFGISYVLWSPKPGLRD